MRQVRLKYIDNFKNTQKLYEEIYDRISFIKNLKFSNNKKNEKIQ